MAFLLYAFNLLVLLFWIRLWSAPEKEFYFNPFLSGTVNLTDSILAFLRPVLFLPEQAAALVVILFITFFKTVLFYRLNIPWTLQLGTYFQFTPDVAEGKITALLLFSFLHAALFLVRLWTVFLLVQLITPPFRTTRATEALAFFARPFSRVPFLMQPLVLIAVHAVIAFTVSHTGSLNILGVSQGADKPAIVSPFLEGPLWAQFLKTGWLAALSIADGLMLLTRGLFVLIIANLGAALLQARGAVVICSEGVELLLGRFVRNGVGGMGFDFTPLIFFFVVDLMYNGICRVLYELISSPYLK